MTPHALPAAGTGPLGQESLGLALSLVAAMLMYAIAAVRGAQGREAWDVRVWWLGLLGHGASLTLDIFGIGVERSGARLGFAPALSIAVWWVLAVYTWEGQWRVEPGLRRRLSLLGLASLALVWVFPGAMLMRGVEPWASLHWALGMACYGLFAAAVLHAVMWSQAERRLRDRLSLPLEGAEFRPFGMPLMKLEKLSLRLVAAGQAVLTVVLLLGVLSKDGWHWNHKSVFSLLAWALVCVLLWGHWRQGWRGLVVKRLIYVSAALLLLAYAGSRFVLEVLLHRGAAA